MKHWVMRTMLLVVALLFGGVPAMAASYVYYMPWISNAGSQWSGLAFTNLSTTEKASTWVTVFKADGAMISHQTLSVPIQGQIVMTVGGQDRTDGWVVVESDQKLGGLCFVGDGSSWVYDVPFSETRSRYWVVPHSAEDGVWKSYIMLCNSKVGDIKATMEFRDPLGHSLFSEQITVPGGQSIRVPVSDLCQGTLQLSGSIWVASDNLPFSVFCLYSSLESGGRSIAGINAVPVDSVSTDIDPFTKAILGSWHFWFTISGIPFDAYYTLDKLDKETNSEGYPIVLGIEDYSNKRTVAANYYPSIGKYALLEQFNSSYYRYYEFSTDGVTVTGAAIWKLDPVTLDKISVGYVAYGERTRAAHEAPLPMANDALEGLQYLTPEKSLDYYHRIRSHSSPSFPVEELIKRLRQ